MKLSIKGKLYEPASLDRLTLREIIALEAATAELGRPLKWPQIKAMAEDAEAMGMEFADSDDALWVIALMVYATKLRAGETVTFADSVDFELGEIDWVLEDGDVDPAQDSTGAAAGPRQAPRAAGRPDVRRGGTTAKKKR